MGRTEEIINYANSYQGKGIEIEELKDVIKLAIIDGALWADANPKWKPSDEQLEAIRLARTFVTDDFGENPTLSEILIELEEQLKKL